MFNSERKKANKVARAIVEGRFDLAAEMLRTGAKPDGMTKAGYFRFHDDKCTSLMAAVRQGQIELVRMLLEQGADPSARDGNGRTALHYLKPDEDVKNPTIVHLLVSYDASIDAVDDRGLTALVTMMDSHRRFGAVAALLRHGARQDKIPSYYGSLLCVAARRNEPEVISELIHYGADVRATLGKSYTALHMAASEGHGDVVKVLIAHGADPLAKDEKMNTPADLAQEKYPGIANYIRQQSGLMPLGDNGWIKVSDDEIGLVSEKAAVGYRLTEIFNFARAEATVIARNLETGSESLTVRPFDACEVTVLRAAAQQLTAFGGRVQNLPTEKSVKLISKG